MYTVLIHVFTVLQLKAEIPVLTVMYPLMNPQITPIPKPINKVINKNERPNGILVERVSVPLGVIGIIYESRPNVTIDASVLCLKAGNSVILRGGKESYYSNLQLVTSARNALEEANYDKNIIQFIETTDRNAVDYMLAEMSQYIDVIIPIESVTANPLIGPVPIAYKIKAAIRVVMFASKIVTNALENPSWIA